MTGKKGMALRSFGSKGNSVSRRTHRVQVPKYDATMSQMLYPPWLLGHSRMTFWVLGPSGVASVLDLHSPLRSSA